MAVLWPDRPRDVPEPDPPVNLKQERLGPEIRKELEKVQIKTKVRKERGR